MDCCKLKTRQDSKTQVSIQIPVQRDSKPSNNHQLTKDSKIDCVLDGGYATLFTSQFFNSQFRVFLLTDVPIATHTITFLGSTSTS